MDKRANPKGTVVAIRNFAGMAPHSNPHAIPPGSSIRQINVAVGPKNEFRVRRGCRQLKFDQ